MMVRMWHGRVPAAKADRYRIFLNERAIPDYRSVPDNIGVQILERRDGEVSHFIGPTFRASLAAIHAFAGDNAKHSEYHPEDREYLLEYEYAVVHHKVVGST